MSDLLTESWRDTLPEDLKSSEALGKFNDVGALASSYIQLEKKLGSNPLIKPGEGASEEEVAAFYTALGRPENADGYEMPEIEGLPEGFAVDDERLGSFRQKAHSLGLTPAQAGGLYKTWVGWEVASTKEADDARKAAETQLRSEWGESYSANVQLAQKVLKKVAGEDFEAIGSTFGNDARVIKMLAKLGKGVSEDTLTGDTTSGMTPEEAQRKINEMVMDPKHPLNDELHPDHAKAVEEQDKLIMIAAGVSTSG